MQKFSEFGFEQPAELNTLVTKLSGLRSNLQSLGAGNLLLATELAAAPVITNWRLMLDFHVCLRGDVVAHPLLSGNRRIMTSELIVDARDLGWMRTFSRFYRLGKPMADGAEMDEDSVRRPRHLRLV